MAMTKLKEMHKGGGEEEGKKEASFVTSIPIVVVIVVTLSIHLSISQCVQPHHLLHMRPTTLMLIIASQSRITLFLALGAATTTTKVLKQSKSIVEVTLQGCQ